MSVVKQIVCLANARKGGERCIAGKELLPDGTLGGWIRPVSRARQDGALSLGERRYLNGEEPALLDIIELRVDDVEPADFQRENWTLGRDNQFKRVGLFTQSDLASGLDSPEELWINGHDAPSNRKNSRVPIDQARAQLTCSLYLIEVDNVRVTTGTTGRAERSSMASSDTGRWRTTTSSTSPIRSSKRCMRTRLRRSAWAGRASPSALRRSPAGTPTSSLQP